MCANQPKTGFQLFSLYLKGKKQRWELLHIPNRYNQL